MFFRPLSNQARRRSHQRTLKPERLDRIQGLRRWAGYRFQFSLGLVEDRNLNSFFSIYHSFILIFLSIQQRSMRLPLMIWKLSLEHLLNILDLFKSVAVVDGAVHNLNFFYLDVLVAYVQELRQLLGWSLYYFVHFESVGSFRWTVFFSQYSRHVYRF